MASTGEVWKLGHRPALDGVRGVAILMVLAGHFSLPGVHDQGQTGVAVFFTLSGFLITALLLSEYDRANRVDFPAFYRRRFLRLVPAQVVCVAVMAAVLLPLGMLPLSDAVQSALYVRNLFPLEGAFAHFWSLAVEEQFYLVWPPLLVLMLRRWSLPLVRFVAFGGAFGALVLRVTAGDHLDQLGVFDLSHSLPLQADPILIGCALAAWMHGREEGRTRPGLASSGVVMVLALMASSQAGYTRPVAAVATAVVLFAVGQGQGTHWLSAGALALVGRRSYAVYLWHYPLLILLYMLGVSGAGSVVIVVSLTAGLAALSWRYVERPCLVIKGRAVSPRRRTGAARAGSERCSAGSTPSPARRLGRSSAT